MLIAALGGLARIRRALCALAALALALEAAAFLAQSSLALVAPTAAVHLLLAFVAGGVVARELRLRDWLLNIARIETAATQEVLKQVIGDSSDAVVVVDEDGRILHMSRRAGDLFGCDGSDTGGRRAEDVLPRELAADIRASVADARAGRWSDPGLRHLTLERVGEPRAIEFRAVPSMLPAPRGRSSAGGSSVWVACLTARDITERLKQQAQVERLSRFDELTGAMRRAEFLKSLQAQSAADGAKSVAVFALKLRRFRTINATLGREVGDAVLREVVRRLQACEPQLRSAARLGSDIFAVHSAAPVDPDEAEALGRALVAAICTPYELAQSTARIGAHVGIAALAADGAGPGAALDRAEEALEAARKVGGDAIRAFDPASAARQEKARRIERALWPALQEDQFFLVYQPQVRLSDLRLVGAEALLRWRHPTLGLVSPADFIGIAEACGFIGELGRWVLRRACTDAVRWMPGTTVAVNVSPVQFQRNDVVGDVREALETSGLPASRLQLEITESIFVEGSREVLETLQDLRMMGVTLALDDFGAGFSSFGYLASFALNKIKADQMFVRRLAPGDKNSAILKSMASLAAELGLTFVAEGVETEQQLAFLRSIGCDEGQGYLFGKPLPQDQTPMLAGTTTLPDDPALFLPAAER